MKIYEIGKYVISRIIDEDDGALPFSSTRILIFCIIYVDVYVICKYKYGPCYI